MKIIPGLENCNIAPYGDIFAHRIIVPYISFHFTIDGSDVGDNADPRMSPTSKKVIKY